MPRGPPNRTPRQGLRATQCSHPMAANKEPVARAGPQHAASSRHRPRCPRGSPHTPKRREATHGSVQRK
eukprot:1089972-Alexandrium_andersonii.AAC.1